MGQREQLDSAAEAAARARQQGDEETARANIAKANKIMGRAKRFWAWRGLFNTTYKTEYGK